MNFGMKHYLFLSYFLFILGFQVIAQNNINLDSLAGSITNERAWWDLSYYHLEVNVNPNDSTIRGKNTIHYKVLNSNNVLQVDLKLPLKITSVKSNGQTLSFTKIEYHYFITLPETPPVGSHQSIEIEYQGRPRVAVNPPWQGGVSWKKDKNGMPFIATSNQSIGASVWWPCKDHPYDEPDSMQISITVPDHLTDVSNGRLRKVDDNQDGTKTFHWFVSNPINNYGVNINIADYAHFSEIYEGENGPLTCDYYVLKNNLERAKNQFREVKRMFEAFEHWFGPYPFYEDGYKLVEVPYLGMEHQSSVTYGNGYANGYRGTDLSSSGWGHKFDFIIVHESGHEWFANNITYKDRADMWIHESFTNYSESLFLEYHYGKEAGRAYVIGTRARISNDKPIIGPYNLNRTGSGDMYYKGGNMLHTLRQIVNDDNLWRAILRGLNQTYYHQTVDSKQVEDYIQEKTNLDLTAFFDQYLRDTKVPVLEYYQKDGNLFFKWNNCVDGFNMPIDVKLSGKMQRIHPKTNWNKIKMDKKNLDLEISQDYYVGSLNTNGS